MKPKTKQMLDLMIAEPKISQTEAYIRTHKTESRKVAGIESTRLLKKPKVQLYLKRHRDMAKETKVRILNKAKVKENDIKWQNLANDVAEQILDRTDGKPVQRQLSKSEHLIKISLGSK